MSTTKFVSKTHLCLNVAMPSGKNAHVSFSAMTGGGSVFYTDNEQLIQAIKKHRYYGKAFKEVTEDPAVSVPLDSEGTVDSSESGTVIKVKSLDEAKDYLCEQYGLSRTKLKGVDGVKKAAAAYSITFEGI